MRHIRLYEAVDAVARHGSIRRAAEALAISPSALNRQILGLEEDIGAPIFERLSRGVRLSTEGEIYLRCFRAHLAELDRAASQIADLSGLRAGAVRLGVSEELATEFAAGAIAAYQSKHPMVSLQTRLLSADDASLALSTFDIDLAVAVNPIHDETIETLHAEQAGIVCVAAHDSGLAETVRLSDLVDRPLLAPGAGSGLRRALDAAFAARNTPRRYALETDRLAPARLQSDLSAVQFALALDLDPVRLAAEGLAMSHLDPRSAPPVTIAILKLRRRVLPVPAGKFAQDLARRIPPID